MYIAKDIKRSGSVYYRYKYRDRSGKLLSVPASEHAHLDNSNLAQMQNHLKYFEAKYDSRAKEAEERESWHDKYYNFQELFEVYKAHMIDQAPRSWESKVSYFRYYVLPYFLNEQGAVNLEEWRIHFSSFKAYLKQVKQVRANKLLSLNSQNHCITELNNFLTVMANQSPPRCDVQPKCPQLHDKTQSSLKSLDEVFSDAEVLSMEAYLRDRSEVAADLFLYLIDSGCRIQEALGIGPSNVLKRQIPHEQLHKILGTLGLSSYRMHVYFSRQLDNSGVVQDDEEPIYVGLKGKYVIHERHTRYVPIFTERTEAVITRRMRQAKEDFTNIKYGPNKDSYLLFGREISQSMLARLMSSYYDVHPEFFRKTPHDCRHTQSTHLASLDISGVLGKIILGQTEKTQKRYNHLSEQMARVNTRKNVDVFDDF